MQKSFVYILKCRDGTYFTGITNDIAIRLQQHHAGDIKNCYTYKRRPLTLVYVCGFVCGKKAFARANQIKKWSQAKKEALMNEEFEKLPSLARKHFD